MKSHPSSQDVFDDIGEKPLVAFASSVLRARRDLADYRIFRPHWVAEHGERGLANWISDRLWAHLVYLGDGVPGMNLVESGVTREIGLGVNYRLRFKRHDELGLVASYPTPTFLEFASQPSDQLPGLEETRLIVGYEWIKDLRNIGDAVMSLRDGKDKIIWCERLPYPGEAEAGGDTAPVVAPASPSPKRPTITLGDDIGQQSKDSSEDE
jgi:hypothetical protein